MSTAPRENPKGSTAELRALAVTALSRLHGDAKSQRAQHVNVFNHVLSAYGRTAVRRGGKLRPAPCPDVPGPPFPSGIASFRALGIDRDRLEQQWNELLERDDVEARLPDSLLEAFFPRGLWPALDQIVLDGPALAAARLQRIVWRESQRRVPPTRSRPDGGFLSRNTVQQRVTVTRAFFATLCDLNALGYPSALLDAWVAVPPPPRIPAEHAGINRSAPPRHLLRLAWRELDQKVRRYLGCASPEEELEAVASLSEAALRRGGGFRVLRDRALLFVFCVVGARVGAASRLRVQDHVLDRLCPDGNRRPALGLRIGKGKGWERRWKPIPHDANYVLTTYRALAVRCLGREPNPEWPLFFTSLRRPDVPWSPNAISARFAGEHTRRHPTPALVPFDPAALGKRASELEGDEYQGYSPHCLRRAALQIARLGARRYMEEGELEIEPETVGDILLDHQIDEDKLGYADLDSARGREHWSGVAVELGWRMLTTDFGAQRMRDEEALRSALRKREALETELGRVRRRIDQRQVASIEATSTRGRPSAEKLLAALQAKERDEELYRLELRVRDELARVELEIERVRHDPRRRVAIPDEALLDGAAPDMSGLEELIQDDEVRRRRGRRVRDWVSVKELGIASGISEAEARRWANGETLPHRPGHPHNPWEKDDIPIDESLGHSRRRVIVDRLKPGFIDLPGVRDAIEGFLKTWPRGWSAEACDAPIILR